LFFHLNGPLKGLPKPSSSNAFCAHAHKATRSLIPSFAASFLGLASAKPREAAWSGVVPNASASPVSLGSALRSLIGNFLHLIWAFEFRFSPFRIGFSSKRMLFRVSSTPLTQRSPESYVLVIPKRFPFFPPDPPRSCLFRRSRYIWDIQARLEQWCFVRFLALLPTVVSGDPAMLSGFKVFLFLTSSSSFAFTAASKLPDRTSHVGSPVTYNFTVPLLQTPPIDEDV